MGPKWTHLSCLIAKMQENTKTVPERVQFWCSEDGGGMGGFKTRQTRHIGVFDVSWKGRKVLFGDGFVIMRMREGRGEVGRGLRHVKHGVSACLTCLEGREGVGHKRGHRTQRTCLPGCVLHVLEGAWL